MKTNWNEALTHYGLGYSVEKRPLYAMIGEGKNQVIDNLYSIVRTDTNEPLPGVAVAGRYEILQTSQYADIGNRICNETKAEFVRGGQLMGGRGLFLQAKLPDSIRVKGTDDLIDKLLTFITSHDGSLCFMVLPTALRLFCANQMNALRYDMRNALKIRHTRSAHERLKQADQIIMDSMNAYKQFQVKVDWLADQKFTDLQMNIATRKLFNVKDDVQDQDIHGRTLGNINKIKELFTEGNGQHVFRGTAWAAFNAVSEFADHERAVRKNTDRFEAGLIGSGTKIKQRGLDLIASMVS